MCLGVNGCVNENTNNKKANEETSICIRVPLYWMLFPNTFCTCSFCIDGILALCKILEKVLVLVDIRNNLVCLGNQRDRFS